MTKTARVIVIGNEKGGSGKTTTAMHLIVYLLNSGFKVASIDLDDRQRSLTHYVENRKNSINTHNLDLRIPDHFNLSPSTEDSKKQSELDDEIILKTCVNQLRDSYDFIIIDTPGNNTAMGRAAHSIANTVITPVNDSFIDLDLIGNIDGKDLDSKRPGIYSAMFWEQKMKRIKEAREEIQWIVVRNRYLAVETKNQKKIQASLEKLSKKFGFKVLTGFGDRVVFKDLFLDGFTISDSQKMPTRNAASLIMPHLELAGLIRGLAFPEVVERSLEVQTKGREKVRAMLYGSKAQ